MSKSDIINPHKVFQEKVGLAQIYLEDGAFYTSADVLRELADKIDAHTDAVNKEYGMPTKAELKSFNMAGS